MAVNEIGSMLTSAVLYYSIFEMEEVKELLQWKAESVSDFIKKCQLRTKWLFALILTMMLSQSVIIVLLALQETRNVTTFESYLDLVLRLPKLSIDLYMAYMFFHQFFFFLRKIGMNKSFTCCNKVMIVWIAILWVVELVRCTYVVFINNLTLKYFFDESPAAYRTRGFLVNIVEPLIDVCLYHTLLYLIYY
jgi:hypothetical protein